jgi:hypothetical protein
MPTKLLDWMLSVKTRMTKRWVTVAFLIPVTVALLLPLLSMPATSRADSYKAENKTVNLTCPQGTKSLQKPDDIRGRGAIYNVSVTGCALEFTIFDEDKYILDRVIVKPGMVVPEILVDPTQDSILVQCQKSPDPEYSCTKPTSFSYRIPAKK